MGWTVNNSSLRGSLEGILEGIDDICNTDGEVLGERNGNNQLECRF